MKYCPKCGAPCVEQAVYCTTCGVKLADFEVKLVESESPLPERSRVVSSKPAVRQTLEGQVHQTIIIQPSTATPAQLKNPWLATALSIIFPGLGQFYNGHPGKGILTLLSFWLIIPWVWSIFDAYSSATTINRRGW